VTEIYQRKNKCQFLISFGCNWLVKEYLMMTDSLISRRKKPNQKFYLVNEDSLQNEMLYIKLHVSCSQYFYGIISYKQTKSPNEEAFSTWVHEEISKDRDWPGKIEEVRIKQKVYRNTSSLKVDKRDEKHNVKAHMVKLETTTFLHSHQPFRWKEVRVRSFQSWNSEQRINFKRSLKVS